MRRGATQTLLKALLNVSTRTSSDASEAEPSAGCAFSISLWHVCHKKTKKRAPYPKKNLKKYPTSISYQKQCPPWNKVHRQSLEEPAIANGPDHC